MTGNEVRRSRTALVVVLLLVFLAGLAAGVLGGARIRRGLGLADGSAAPAQAGQLWTCGMHPQVIQDRPGTCPICGMALTPVASAGSAEHQDAASAGSTLLIDPTVVQNMGLRVTRVREAPLARSIRAVGVLAEPEPARYDVNLRVGGWIDQLHAGTEGMRLSKGDPLFDLYSPDLQVAIGELIGARKMRGTLAAATQADVLEESAARKLVLYGLSREQVDELAALDTAPRTVTMRSPADGYLVEKTVYAGSAVAAGDTVMRIADTSKLWLDARVFEKDLPHVRIGQEASARVDSRPGEAFEGRVVLVHPRIDPATRTALVRMELDNEGLALRHGMFATAFLEVEVAPRAIVVPREAVIDTGARQVAFVALDGGHFEPRKVELGASGNEGLVQVLSGLAPGEQVVVSGQFLLDAESRMKEAIQRFLQEKAPSTRAFEGVSEAWKRAAEELLGAYLDVAGVLGMPQTSDEPVDVARLVRASAALREQGAHEDPIRVADALVSASAGMQGRPIDEQRKLFGAVSEAAIELARRSPRTGELAPRLYVVHCPMVNARWLQDVEEIANPYYATTMKACGEVESALPIPANEGEPR